jgi:cytochrome c-type biogenesis protein CcmH/NrfF
VFLAALLLIALAYRRRQASAETLAPLSVNEKRKLKRLLDES